MLGGGVGPPIWRFLCKYRFFYLFLYSFFLNFSVFVISSCSHHPYIILPLNPYLDSSRIHFLIDSWNLSPKTWIHNLSLTVIPSISSRKIPLYPSDHPLSPLLFLSWSRNPESLQTFLLESDNTPVSALKISLCFPYFSLVFPYNLCCFNFMATSYNPMFDHKLLSRSIIC